MKSRIQFLVSIGGYYNLLESTKYSITGRYPGSAVLEQPDRWGRMIFAMNHVQQLAPSTDASLLYQILRLRLNMKDHEAKQMEQGLTGEGKEFLNGVLNGLTQAEMLRFEKILEVDRHIAKELSPETVVNHLSPDLRIYLLHGSGDNSIPSYETVELDRALKRLKHADVHLLITPSLSHVDPLKMDTWIDKARLILWTTSFLREAKRHGST
jgi:hypothetical protein